jgi:hypothetical protein
MRRTPEVQARGIEEKFLGRAHEAEKAFSFRVGGPQNDTEKKAARQEPVTSTAID